jgi:CRP-like cAMP-binding protein
MSDASLQNPILSTDEAVHDSAAFPLLTEEELREAGKCGRRECYDAGQMLFEAGARGVDFIVIVSGGLEVIGMIDNEERVLVVHPAGGFLGNIGLFSGGRPIFHAGQTSRRR